MVFLEFHGIGTQPILEAVSLFHVPLQVEVKGGRLVPFEKVPEDLQTRLNIQFPPNGGKLGQVGDEFGAHTGEIGAGLVNIPLGHCNGDVAVLHHAVVGAGHFRKQHLVVLFPEWIQPVLLHGQQQGFLKFLFVDLPVVDGNLGAGPGVQGIEQLRIIQEHGGLVVFPGDAVIDIGKGKGFGEPAPHLKNPIRPNAPDGHGVLYGLGYGEFLFF